MERLLKQMENLINEVHTLITTISASGFTSTHLQPVKDCNYTLFEWLDEWYNTYKKPILKNPYQIENCINKHIKSNFKNTFLNNLSPLDMQQNLNKIDGTRMQKYTFDTLNSCLKKAFMLGYINENPMLKVENVRHTRKKGVALTKVQERNLKNIISGSIYENLFLFYLASGCRFAEALSIRYCDIDYENNQIYIRGTKTEHAERYIPLLDDIRFILNNIKQEKKESYIFPFKQSAVKSYFKRIKEKHNLNYSIHSLRHTFATRWLEKGIKLHIVSKWLGHADSVITAKYYIHVLSDFEKEELLKHNPNMR